MVALELVYSSLDLVIRVQAFAGNIVLSLSLMMLHATKTGNKLCPDVPLGLYTNFALFYPYIIMSHWATA